MDACHRFHRRAATLAFTVTVAAALVAAAVVDPTSADPRDDKRRADAAVGRASAILEGATARARLAARKLDAVSAALPGARRQVAETRGRVAAAAVEANTARREEDRARQVREMAARRYEQSVRRVREARERVARFVSATYKGGDIVTLNVLLDSRTVEDLTQRSGYFDRILTTERRSVDDLLDSRRSARRDELEAESARREAEQARNRADAALRAARAARQRAEAAQTALATLAVQRAGALAAARQERVASLARYEQARAEAARITTELRAWQARHRDRDTGPTLRPGSRFLMPVRGWKSSDFGMRFDPFFRVWQLHAGVDLAADGGQPIFAAASGWVIRAGYNGGYGNFTCLSHGSYLGQGLSTCYAHQSTILVAPGEWVHRGDVIGRVGTTGASTGYHLHFEVRLDGTPRQPLGWLPGCLC